MSEPMTLTRFRDLADAYGGIVARWPERDRDAATQIASSTAGAEILAAALMLDQALDTWCLPGPGEEILERLLSLASQPRHGVVRRARWWWSGIGIAAVLTGAAAGAVAVAIVAPIEASPDSATSFGDVVAQES